MSEEQKLLTYYMVMFSPDEMSVKTHGVNMDKQEAKKLNEKQEQLLESWGLDLNDIKSELENMSGEFT